MYQDQENNEAEERVKKQAEMDERRKKNQEEVDRKHKVDKKRNLERKRADLEADLMQISNKMQTAKVLIGQLETEAGREGERGDKITREVTEMKRELERKKGMILRMEREIENKENEVDGQGGSNGNKKQELEEKKKKFQELDNDRSSIDHQIMRIESELRNFR